jgi:thiol:disulfide interchange protein DsbA
MRIHSASLAGLAGLALSLIMAIAPAAAQQFQEGRHYRVLSNPVATTTGDRIEVREFFSYGCPHCKTFQPRIAQFAEGLADDVELVHSPVVFSQAWQPLAQAYLTADALDMGNHMHGVFFKAYHEQGKPMGSADDVARIFAEHGVDDDAFRKAWNSFGVDGALRRAERLSRAHQVQSTPSMAVNGKYVIDVREAGGQDQMLQVVQYLVERERQARQ